MVPRSLLSPRVYLLAPLLDLFGAVDAEAVGPLGERDAVVVVGVAPVQEVPDAVLKRLEGHVHMTSVPGGR